MLRELVREVARASPAPTAAAPRQLTPGEPPLENDTAIVSARARADRGRGPVIGSGWRSCGSDDFAFFGALAPIAMAFVGLDGAAGFATRPLHHPELLVPDAAVGAVARTQAVLYLAAALAARA